MPAHSMLPGQYALAQPTQQVLPFPTVSLLVSPLLSARFLTYTSSYAVPLAESLFGTWRLLFVEPIDWL